MKIGSATSDFDPDDLVERIMALPMRDAMVVSECLQQRHPDWSFLRELSDEIRQLDVEQRKVVAVRLAALLQGH